MFLVMVACADSAWAQEPRLVEPPPTGVHVDTLDIEDPRLRRFAILESLTLTLDGDVVESSQYEFDPSSGRLTLVAPTLVGQVMIARYRTLPLGELSEPIALREVQTAPEDTSGLGRIVSRTGAPPEDPIFGDLSGLRRRGAIRRGIITGNRRDVSLESGLRLELDGEIADGLTLQAVLTDENTPIQPEGTTQRLTDLDRVYIQLDHSRGQARLGDVDLAFRGTAFAPFDRKLQGAAVRVELPAALDGIFAGGSVTTAGAVTRGQFRSIDIEPVEGVQGPYRLTGQRGEELIIVIAGSERVYLDGRLLTRGEANDYVIDYATGEVTFTPRHLITSERRLTVDFEYTTGAFTRTLLASEVDLGFGRVANDRPRAQLRATVLREADGSSFADELGLTEADLDLIAAAGAAPAVRSGAERVPYDPESPFVLYTRRDTTLAGEVYSIFVLATPQDAEVYRVRFSRVEPGQGDYVRGGRAVNGVLFEWVGPGAGNYVPLRILPRPEQRYVVDIAGSVEPVAGLELFGEVAQSGFDVNRLSDLETTDRAGGAYLGGARLRAVDALGGSMSGEVVARVRGATFTPFDRIRPVEFNRRWNLARAGSAFVGIDSLREQTVEGFAEWSRPMGSRARLEAGQLELGDRFSGVRAGFDASVREAGLPTFDWRIDYVDATNQLVSEEGVWFRQHARLAQPMAGAYEPFLEFEYERRSQYALGTDSLAVTALAFWEVRPGVAVDRGDLRGGLSVGYREEQLPLHGAFTDAATALTVRSDLRYRAGNSFNTDAEVAFRRRIGAEVFAEQGLGDIESVALRWSTRWSPLDRAVELNSVYSASTERTPILQEVFIRVGPELGEWVWEDLNGDGIQQVDEFRPQNFPLEGEYLRVFLPGDDLTPTASVQAQLRLRLDPSRFFGAEGAGWRSALREMQSFTTIDLQERTEAEDLIAVYLLRPHILQQEATTLQGRIRLSQEFTFFRNRPGFGGRIAGSHLRSTSTLASGLDRRLVQRVEAEANYQVVPPLGVRLRGLVERNDAASAIASRTFELRTQEIEPEATYRVSDHATVTGSVRVARSHDVASDRQSWVTIVPLRARISLAGRMQVLVRAERAHVSLSGLPPTGQVYFELTQRRGPGTSYLWSASGQYTINRYLRATLNIEGRAPADAPVFHTIRLQMSALF